MSEDRDAFGSLQMLANEIGEAVRKWHEGEFDDFLLAKATADAYSDLKNRASQ